MSSRTILSKIDDEQKSLGVGLAVVARYIKNVKGQIRVQSELGKGKSRLSCTFLQAASLAEICRMI